MAESNDKDGPTSAGVVPTRKDVNPAPPQTGLKLAFKKRKKKQKHLRQKGPVDHSVDEEEEEERLASLEQTREMQKARSRKFKMISTSALTTTRLVDEPSSSKNADDGSEDRESKKFLGSFSEEVLSNPVNVEREKYIEEQLRLKRIGKSSIEEEKQILIKKKTIQEQLFEIPEKYKERKYIDTTEESGDRWLAGITEVALPIETKLKNIEDTEKAKRMLLEGKERSELRAKVPRNFNSDFRAHHHEHLSEMEQKRKRILKWQKAKDDQDGTKPKRRKHNPDDDGDASQENITADGSRLPFATDHELMQRFVRRYKNR